MKTRNRRGATSAQYHLFTGRKEEVTTVQPPRGADVPILVETLDRPFFPMVRCHYLAFQYSDPRAGTALRIEGFPLSMPFLLLGLIGIIQQPIEERRFTSPLLIDNLYEQLEDKAGLLITFEDLWLPRFLFERETRVGDVFRITNELFQHAYRFREGRLIEKMFIRMLEQFSHSMVFSEEETRAFWEWSDKQVFRALHLPPKDPELRLIVGEDSDERL